jgi:hypothetical protein
MRRAPGRNLLALARRILSRAEIDRLVEPAIADLQHEWAESASRPLNGRLVVRTHAYAAAVFFVTCRVLVGALLASLTPPPWFLIRQLIVPLIVMCAVGAAFRLFLGSARDTAAIALLETIASVSVQIAWLPFLWPAMLPRRTSKSVQTSSMRAGNLARVSGIWCALCLIWSGWIGPSLRYRYLAIGDAAEQWLPELIGPALSSPLGPEAFEVHRRLMVVAIVPIAAVLAWVTLRPRADGLHQSSLLAHLGRGTAVAVTAVAVGTFFRASVGSIASEWIAVLVAAIGAAMALLAFRMAERWPREPMERNA